MIPILARFCLVFICLTTATSAQTNANNSGVDVSKILLTKDLKQVIAEAERDSRNDLPSLLRLLDLYQRAAHGEKIESTVKQLVTLAESANNRYIVAGTMLYVAKEPLYKDTETLQRYLRLDFNSEVFGRLTELCLQYRNKCDVEGFDGWLEQRTSETSPGKGNGEYFSDDNDRWTWIARRIGWRKRFGLDNSGILSEFAESVRKNPADLDTALRFLAFAENVQRVIWLAELFSSERAYDYYELGERLIRGQYYAPRTEADVAQIHQTAARLLLKSLSLPFSDADVSPIYAYRLRYASIQPNIKNHEKQLRFWTKTELAAVYTKMGRPQDAQPIVEELMSTDTTDIISYKPSHLAGQVQSGSGARVLESKILVEQALRQNSYEYWEERIAYYVGRKEAERVFESYLNAFRTVPFNISDRNSSETRLHYIRRFVDYASDSNYRLFTPAVADWNEMRTRFDTDTQAFLKNEFEKTKSSSRYAYQLVEIIDLKFDDLADQIISSNPQLIVDAAKGEFIYGYHGGPGRFFDNKSVTRTKKDAVFAELLKVAEKKGVAKAWALCDALNDLSFQEYVVQLVPILARNLRLAELKTRSTSVISDDFQETKDIRDKYAEVLFDTYLTIKDWKAAEKLVWDTGSPRIYSPYDRLALSSAANGAADDAVRLWKIKSNANRRDLDNLSSLASFPAIASGLRTYYEQMKIDEPYSPVPDLALKILK